jgi:Replication-relaxation
MLTTTNPGHQRSRRRRSRTHTGSAADRLAALAGRLTDRDRRIIHLVHEHRVFTTPQLTEVCFDSQDRAEHRLRQLTHAQVLARFRPHTRHGQGSAPYHYVLGPAGAAVLAAEHGIEPRRLGYRQDKALEVAHSQRLGHLVGVNGFFTALVASARQRGAGRAVLAAWWSERRCRDRWGHVVRPDGYGRWRQGDREVDFFLEYDRGTEPTDRLKAKLASYQELADATTIPTPVLFWLPSSGREATVRQALASESRWTKVPFLVATGSPALARGPAEQAWLPLDQTGPRRRLIELADLDPAAGGPRPPGQSPREPPAPELPCC